jgi:hypothetical protein
MFGVSAQKSIPGIEGELELSWATAVPKSLAADSDFAIASAGGLEEEQGSKALQEENDHNSFNRASANNQDDMDYEGGDWGIS